MCCVNCHHKTSSIIKLSAFVSQRRPSSPLLQIMNPAEPSYADHHQSRPMLLGKTSMTIHLNGPVIFAHQTYCRYLASTITDLPSQMSSLLKYLPIIRSDPLCDILISHCLEGMGRDGAHLLYRIALRCFAHHCIPMHCGLLFQIFLGSFELFLNGWDSVLTL